MKLIINIKSILQQIYFVNICYNTLLCIVRRFPISVAIFCYVPISSIPRTTKFSHPFGIVIRRGTVIGENCTIRQHVTIGQRRQEDRCAKIGKNVEIGAGAMILGDITIGDNCIIGAGAIVLKDVLSDTVVVGVYK